MELFLEKNNSFQLLTIFAKTSTLDIRLCSEYSSDSVSIYLLKVDNGNTRTKFPTKIIRTEKDLQLLVVGLFKYVWPWRLSAAFIVNFEAISHFVLILLLLTLNR